MNEILVAAQTGYESDGPGKRLGLFTPDTLWNFIASEIENVTDGVTEYDWTAAIQAVEAVERDAQAVRFALEAGKRARA